MTPAVELVRSAGVGFTIHEYDHDPAASSWGDEAAAALGVEPERVCKTLISKLDGGTFVVGIVPVPMKLNLKSLAKAAGARRAAMAEPGEVRRATGYVLGAVSPLGQRRRLPSFIDETSVSWPTIFVSAGRRGVEIELSPESLRRLIDARVADISR